MLKLAFLLVLLISASLNVRALGKSKRIGVRIQKSCQSQQADVPSFPVRSVKSHCTATPNRRHACGKGLHDDALATSIRGGTAAVGVPPLRLWIGPALVCALMYALETIYIKKASNFIDPVLGGAVLQVVSALLGTLILVAKRATAQSTGNMIITTQPGGYKWAIMAGLSLGTAQILTFTISGMGVQAMQSIPVIIGGCVLMGTLLGRVWLKEELTVNGWCGVLLIAAGIALVGNDPGSK